MKVLAFLLLSVWVLCGIVAAFLIVDTRPMHFTDVALGPISLYALLG